ncbi:MAG: 23S rRNA (adenine(2503)-C(2))-methyltransferase RlmN [Sphaerochaetaceae bacterium]|jgi:23S rRNA (adenine2503-C2)-methyltransferase
MEEPVRMPKSLYALKPNELLGALRLEKSYQGKQVYKWLTQGVTTFDDMTNLSLTLRERLNNDMGSPLSSKIIETQTDESGATKIALQLHDNLVIEAVLLTDKEGRSTACLSSQVGCAMGCTFCRTATMGLERNLKAFEIVEQFVHLRHIDPTVGNIVFMGMGEPMANVSSVLKAISFLHDPKGFDISHRKITISTCGVVPGILQLTVEKVPVGLAVSLVSADNTLRNHLMPINKAYPLEHLKEALIEYQNSTQKRVTLEYVMLKGENIAEKDAKKLATFVRGLDVVVNLIPWNPASELDYQTPTTKEIHHFTRLLDSLGVPYTRRFARGRGISGACGQLATKHLQAKE